MAYRLATALSAILLALSLAAPAMAEPFIYTNARFGTSVTFPLEVFTSRAGEPANGDGMTFLAPDGASLAVYGSNNALDQTPEQLADFSSEGATITYRKVGKDWVVLSGHDGPDIFYHRLKFGRDGVIHAFLLKYPATTRSKYDPLVGAIADSLVGP
ncbi:hypothetical protein ASC75_07700 [Aminobacter sp. DSM 101952]|uniref:hypothetical protein n=1 Tax=Aminobacter sp. DSM 101952 TaxID=2735891 RepID=UPI0006F649FF|nr:hypothetical protein [Aminobacter sp. DSM 101952]KQU70010.1 hypothetical protein ASC75_07700 [Aminobacter sp. DSM 101952]